MKIKISLFTVIAGIILSMLVSSAANADISDARQVVEANISKGLVKDGTGGITDTAAAQRILTRASDATGLTVSVYVTKRGENGTAEVGDTARRYYDKTYGAGAEGVLLCIDDVSRMGVVYYCGGAKPLFKSNIFGGIFNSKVKSVLPDYDKAVAVFAGSVVDKYNANIDYANTYADTAYGTTDGDTAYDKAIASYYSESAAAGNSNSADRNSGNAAGSNGSTQKTSAAVVKDGTGSIKDPAAARKLLERVKTATGLTAAVCITEDGNNSIAGVGKNAQLYYDKTYGANTAGVLLYIDNASRIGFVYSSRGAIPPFYDSTCTAIFEKNVKLALPDYDMAVTVFAESVVSVYNNGGGGDVGNIYSGVAAGYAAEKTAAGTAGIAGVSSEMMKRGAVVFGVTVLIGVLVLVFHINGTYKLKHGASALPYLKDIKFTRRSDILTNSYTTTRHIESSSSGSSHGGGFGGGGGGGGGFHSSGGGGGGGRF